MNPRDVIAYTEHRQECFRREKERARLVALARQYQPREARLFRIFPFRRRMSDATTD